MVNNNQKALDWWDSLPLYESNNLLRKYGYFGHDMGVTEDEIVGIWVDESKPESYTLEEFMHQLKHVVPTEQRREWAQANKHKIIRPQPNDLQKAAQNYADKIWKEDNNNEKYKCKQHFIAGAEWNKEHTYTREDMINAINAGRSLNLYESNGSLIDWLNNYKNNNNAK